jgi:hypothetical protein
VSKGAEEEHAHPLRLHPNHHVRSPTHRSYHIRLLACAISPSVQLPVSLRHSTFFDFTQHFLTSVAAPLFHPQREKIARLPFADPLLDKSSTPSQSLRTRCYHVPCILSDVRSCERGVGGARHGGPERILDFVEPVYSSMGFLQAFQPRGAAELTTAKSAVNLTMRGLISHWAPGPGPQPPPCIESTSKAPCIESGFR